jgi:hypothetical protein
MRLPRSGRHLLELRPPPSSCQDPLATTRLPRAAGHDATAKLWPSKRRRETGRGGVGREERERWRQPLGEEGERRRRPPGEKETGGTAARVKGTPARGMEMEMDWGFFMSFFWVSLLVHPLTQTDVRDFSVLETIQTDRIGQTRKWVGPLEMP